jgi:hypothetical protein
MTLLFCTAPPNVYAFLTVEAYPAAFAPFLPFLPDVPNYTACTNDNERATVKVTHPTNKKTRADIVTMKTTLANVFLKALSLQVRASFLQWRLPEPNIIFADMFMWFVDHYGKTTVEDCEANRQCMAANWHLPDGFYTLVHRLFTGAAFVGCTNFTMADCNIVDIGLRIIKWCSMYANEYKAWIACKAVRPRIDKTFDSFKTFWAAKITLVNQTAIPASQYGYRMAATNNNHFVLSYGETISNFGDAYAATQESVKLQGMTIALMQNQLNNVTLLHGITATINPNQPRGAASAWRFQQSVWIVLTQWEWRRWWRQRRRGLSIAGITTAGSNEPMCGSHPHAIQVLQKLELLPHSW